MNEGGHASIGVEGDGLVAAIVKASRIADGRRLDGGESLMLLVRKGMQRLPEGVSVQLLLTKKHILFSGCGEGAYRSGRGKIRTFVGLCPKRARNMNVYERRDQNE